MFIKSSQTLAFRLESVIRVELLTNNNAIAVQLSDGSATGFAYDSLVEAEAAFDVLLDVLGWIPKPEGAA